MKSTQLKFARNTPVCNPAPGPLRIATAAQTAKIITDYLAADSVIKWLQENGELPVDFDCHGAARKFAAFAPADQRKLDSVISI